mgnify:CR=1 FL=1
MKFLLFKNVHEKSDNFMQVYKKRKQFNLGDETAGRLWKVLLKNLAENQGEDQLYSDLKKYFETKMDTVSTFRSNKRGATVNK